jgi:hypothetical protein
VSLKRPSPSGIVDSGPEREEYAMEDLEHRAFRRGYQDYQTYRKLLQLHPRWATNSRGPTPWWPSEGHEEAYRMGWETARYEGQEEKTALPHLTYAAANRNA